MNTTLTYPNLFGIGFNKCIKIINAQMKCIINVRMPLCKLPF